MAKASFETATKRQLGRETEYFRVGTGGTIQKKALRYQKRALSSSLPSRCYQLTCSPVLCSVHAESVGAYLPQLVQGKRFVYAVFISLGCQHQLIIEHLMLYYFILLTKFKHLQSNEQMHSFKNYYISNEQYHGKQCMYDLHKRRRLNQAQEK